MTGRLRAPGFGWPSLLLALAVSLLVPAAWAAWVTPGRIGSFLTLDPAGGGTVTLSIAPALVGPWSTGQWVVFAALAVGLLSLTAAALTTPSPRTRPAPSLLGGVVTAGVALGIAVLLTVGLPQLSATLWFAPVLFPVGLLIAPPAALCSARFATALGAVCAVAVGAGVGMAGTVGVPLPVPDLVMALAVLAGALTAAAAGGRARHPAQLVTGGLLVGAAEALALLGALWLLVPASRWPNFGELGGTLGLGVAAGAAQGVLLRVALPLFERLSRRCSAVSLAHWGDPAHPLLARLKREAPGTYHHSQAVGELAARAAVAIGGDPAICRVGGFYHDIGKIRRPDAFGENTPDTCHRDLAPGESASLILAHVRDGAELGREYAVPPVIAQFIVEHHGTTTVEFFYNKAKERAAERGERPPRRADYTYAGPRPQSLESALVMLADSAEASSRSLENSSLAEIRDIVEKIYRNKLGTFQFDLCDVTNAQLAVAREIFVAELAASRHMRPQYPDTEYPTQAVDKAALQAAGVTGPAPGGSAP